MGAFAEAAPAPIRCLPHSAIYATPNERPGQVIAQLRRCARWCLNRHGDSLEPADIIGSGTERGSLLIGRTQRAPDGRPRSAERRLSGGHAPCGPAPPGVAAGSARKPARGRSLPLQRTWGPCVYTFHTERVGRPGARRRPTLERIPARGWHRRCPRTRGNGYRAGEAPDSHPVDNACSSRSFWGGVMRTPPSAGTARLHGAPGRLTVEGSRRPGSSRPPS
jgi:hypothetical protein